MLIYDKSRDLHSHRTYRSCRIVGPEVDFIKVDRRSPRRRLRSSLSPDVGSPSVLRPSFRCSQVIKLQTSTRTLRASSGTSNHSSFDDLAPGEATGALPLRRGLGVLSVLGTSPCRSPLDLVVGTEENLSSWLCSGVLLLLGLLGR